MAGKKEIVESIKSALPEISHRTASDIFDAVFSSIKANLEEGERVKIPELGSFSISERAARKGRNPATSEPITIGASRGVRFKPAADIKSGTGSTGPKKL